MFLSTKKEKREEDNIRKKKSHFLQILFYLYSNASTRHAEEESQVRLGGFECWVCSMMLSWSQISRHKLGRQTRKCGGRDRDVREFGAISKDGYDLQKTPWRLWNACFHVHRGTCGWVQGICECTAWTRGHPVSLNIMNQFSSQIWFMQNGLKGGKQGWSLQVGA